MELKHDRHSASMLAEHLVFCPKYRGAVLTQDVREYARKVISDICREMGLEIISLAVGMDYVHIFYRYPPRYSVSEIAKRIKGTNSKLIRERFPELKGWCEGSLWASGCFHGSVGHGAEVVERYIKSQEDLTLEVRLDSLRHY
jgi:putative transposase